MFLVRFFETMEIKQIDRTLLLLNSKSTDITEN